MIGKKTVVFQMLAHLLKANFNEFATKDATHISYLIYEQSL